MYLDSFNDEGVNLSADLEAARRVIETHFLSAGEILTQAIDGIGALIGSLEKLIQALDAKAVAASTDDMREAADALMGLADNHRSRQVIIERISRHRDGLTRCIGEMRTCLAYMRAFTVNIKIVSSGIAEAGSTFESFAGEISDCIESGRAELLRLDDDTLVLQEDLNAALTEGAGLSARIEHFLPVLPNELRECAGQMGGHYGRISEIAADVTTIARHIQQRVVRVLSALQIGDITRQRIEHVQAALRHVEVAVAGGDVDGRLSAIAHALLAAQVSSSISDFCREVAEIEKNMADMASHSRELLKLRDMAYGCCSGKGEGFLTELAERINQALSLVNEIEGADSSALKTGRETAAAAEHLNSRIAAVQALKNDVQYMALNTTIKCAQIGDAALPLSVIALELRDHGQKLDDAAGKGLSALDELSRTAHELAAAGDETHASAASALGIAAELIGEGRKRAETEIALLVEEGERVLDVLDTSTAHLSFRAQIGDTLEKAAAELIVLGAMAPQKADGIEDRVQAMLTQFHSLYTMAQEREVHKKFAEGLGIGYQPPAVKAPAAA